MNYRFWKQSSKIRLVALLPALLMIGASLAAQDQSTQIELNPPNPTPNDEIKYRVFGIWRDGCVPQSPVVSISPGAISIETSNSGMVCTQALSPWSLTGTIGRLAAGDYHMIVTYSGGGSRSKIEIARESFTVAGSSVLNEVVFPIVVNGAVADKLHYQSIFTILNASAQDIQAGLQVYDSAGRPGGAFCSTLAPPPSSLTAVLTPNQEYLQFTSADLPFLNGWARLGWEGSSSILPSVEVTLMAATPSPCLLICNRPSTEKLSSVMMPAVKPAREFRLPATINRNRQTALALVNPSAAEAVSVRISILNASGEKADLGVVNTFDVTIRPLERISKSLWEFALENSLSRAAVPPETFQGSVLLTADAPFAVGALNIMFPEGKFVAVPILSSLL